MTDETTKGVLTIPGGIRYEGELRKGLPHGAGVMTIPKVGKYEGQFRKGLFHGPGVFASATGSGWHYAGWWRQGEPHGPGELEGYIPWNDSHVHMRWDAPWFSKGCRAMRNA